MDFSLANVRRMRIEGTISKTLVGGASALIAVTLLAGCGNTSDESAASPTASAASPTAATTSPNASDTAANPSTSVTASGERVPPSQLSAVVSDRTFTGSNDDVPYTEYYAADGTLRGEEGGETYSGTWAVVGDELCFTYPDEAGGETQVDCYAVYRDGDEIAWVDREGNVTVATWEEGNPKDL